MLLAIGLFIFAVHHWSMILHDLIPDNIQFYIEQFTSIIGALFIAYSTYGLYSSMKKVKEKTK